MNYMNKRTLDWITRGEFYRADYTCPVTNPSGVYEVTGVETPQIEKLINDGSTVEIIRMRRYVRP
jgi:hypothetical protein